MAGVRSKDRINGRLLPAHLVVRLSVPGELVNSRRIVCITGRAGVGKDTLADHLVANHGYTKLAFADPLKQALNARFGWTEKDWLNREFKEREHVQCGYAGSPSDGRTRPFGGYFSPRSWAQWLGTEFARDICGDDVWLRQLAKRIEKTEGHVVVPDVRFTNEAVWMRNMGASILEIRRPSAGHIPSHSSESGIHPGCVDVVIFNERGREEFILEATDAITILENRSGRV